MIIGVPFRKMNNIGLYMMMNLVTKFEPCKAITPGRGKIAKIEQPKTLLMTMCRDPLDYKRVILVSGMPDRKDPIYNCWKGVTLTDNILSTDNKSDSQYYGMFAQDDDISFHLRIEDTGEVIALSGTCRWEHYVNHASQVAVKIADDEKCSPNCRMLAELNIQMIVCQEHFAPKSGIILHNSGLIAIEKYKNCRIGGKKLKIAMFELKLAKLQQMFHKAVLFANSTTMCSGTTYDEFGMQKLGRFCYRAVRIKAPGFFCTYCGYW